MAGHSQFKNIMHRKGAQDAKRARAFAKMIREITVSAREGLPDMAFNPRLRSAVMAARAANMPRDTIERAIKKASGAGAGDDYVEIRYEGYGPGGVAILVDVLTDNKNRAASEIRHAFSKNGGNLGTPGSVAHMFTKKGLIVVEKDAADEDKLTEIVLKAAGEGATDNYQEVRYEGYGPAGGAVIVEALTDNRNRTAPALRTAFNKYGGAMGESGSVSFMFNRLGGVRYPEAAASADAMLEAAIEAGADDVTSTAEGHEVIVSVEGFFAVRDALEQKFGTPLEARIEWRPNITVPLDEEKAAAVLKLLDVLEDDDDVQNVYANFEIADEIMQKLSA